MSRPWIIALVIASAACSGGTSPSPPTAPTSSNPSTPPPAPPPAASPVPTPGSVAGSYTVVFTANAACTTLPASVRSRTLRATITESGSQFAINLTGGNFLSQTFVGAFAVNGVVYGGAFAEMLADGSFLLIGGNGDLRRDGTALVSSLTGTWQFIGALATPNIECNAVHTVRFTR
jgi:hypothetical protein